MNSHIINPFEVYTQFTLQIHIIINLITFKEAMVFDSSEIESFCFMCAHKFYRPSVQVNPSNSFMTFMGILSLYSSTKIHI